MKTVHFNRLLAAVLAVVMLLGMLPLSALAADETQTYVLDIGDVEDVAQSSKADGDVLACGTDDFFTIFFSKKTRIEANSKSFADGTAGTKRLNFGGSTNIGDPVINAVQIKTDSAATVKLYWVCGENGRDVAVYAADGSVVAQNPVEGGATKNGLYITELSIPTAGTYYIGNVGGNNNYYYLKVTQEAGAGGSQRADWASVAAPVIDSAADLGDGSVAVEVTGLVGENGADELVVGMYDADGNLIIERKSIMERDSHKILFTPESSGTYTFQAYLVREGEANKPAAAEKTAAFKLVLESPVLTSATSKGNGTVQLNWVGVKEAVSYEILMGDQVIGSTDQVTYTAEGLTVGQQYTFQIRAVRGEDQTLSDKLTVTVTQEEKVTWGHTYYGPSTNAAGNGYVGDLNEDGQVTVYSEGGKGKIQPGTVDGVSFYYTAIPTTLNFTLRAKVHVDSWTYSNGQEGFGLMVTDRLGVSGSTANFWNNQYMAVATKIEYRYDGDNMVVRPLDSTYTKYSMRLGLGILEKTGITKENLSFFENNDSDYIAKNFVAESYPLDTTAGQLGEEAGNYNIIGNHQGNLSSSIESMEFRLMTDFILEIQKNNTGYFITYYAQDGTVISQQKFYDPDALSQLDEDFVYAGFFAARNARATFSDVVLTTIAPEDDLPAEEKPITKITPTITVGSADVTTSSEYLLELLPNVSGTLRVKIGSNILVDGEYLTGEVRYSKLIQLDTYGEHLVEIQFTPDPDQALPEDTVLSTTNTVFNGIDLMYNRGNYHRKNIYVSPNGQPYNNGTREYPYDIYTAVENVVPGQTIILMEGTYRMIGGSLKIQKGMDGTAEELIRMIADPEAATRPVLDFLEEYAGIVHGGDYWYFAGFDVTRSKGGEKGFQVSGDHNVLDQLHTYRNGNTGIQISRYSGADVTIEDWPSYNLILNCTSYYNSDPGEEDADGFAAKLTCGVGNVFDGCVAYRNADDGWDLYAKVETGCIGAVTIRNCVAYENGMREDGTWGKGNGNGFKMGGASLSGKHVLENSIAFNNKAKGLDSNSCPDITLRNCVAYNNGSYNVALYTNDAANTDFAAEGVISFRDNGSSYTGADNLRPKGSQDASKYNGTSNYYWQGSSCINANGEEITADMFVSLQVPSTIARKADGTIDLQGFLVLKDTAPAGTGANMGGQASWDMTVHEEDGVHNYSDEWYTEDGTNHWKECECGDRGELGAHTFEWVVDLEPQGNTPGKRHQECTVCHAKKPAVTIYPETNPTQPSTEPTGSSAASQPGGSQAGEDDGGIPPIVLLLIVVVVISVAAFLIRQSKKKKQETN